VETASSIAKMRVFGLRLRIVSLIAYTALCETLSCLLSSVSPQAD
jgi:hypothetical protein